jgi:hypothetical protein
MGAQYKSLLFYYNSCWLSRGNVARVYDLREELALFLEEENEEIAEYFRSEAFLLKLAYLSDIFEKFHLLNTGMQGYDTNVLVVSDKVNAFVRKIGLWVSKIEEGNLDTFPKLNAFIEDDNMEISETGIERCIREYLIKLKFCRESLTEFWVGVGEEYPHLSKKAIYILFPFATSYLCETRFSGVAALKTRCRSVLNIESDLRVAISRLQPRYEKLCCKKEPHPSH